MPHPPGSDAFPAPHQRDARALHERGSALCRQGARPSWLTQKGVPWRDGGGASWPTPAGRRPQMQTAQQADLSSICSRRAGRSRGCQPPVAGAFPGRTPLLSSALHLPLYALFFQGTPPVGRLYGLPECARFSLRRASVLWFSPHTSHCPPAGLSSVSATARGGVCDPEAVTLPDSSSSRPAGL